MKVGCIKKTLIRTAKNQLNQHKELGQASTLTIEEVAHLFDIVNGYNDYPALPAKELAFSLN
jgi:hypothetical protein